MGGLSKKCIDCSGLLYMSFRKTFKHLKDTFPRTAHEFGRYGKLIVNPKNLRKGDLVFFIGTYRTSKFITHAGIYLGKEKFIHTSASKGVMVSNINDKYYWKKKFCYGKRVFNGRDKKLKKKKA